MTHETKEIGATLLYPFGPTGVFDQLSNRMAAEFEKSGLGLIRKLATHDDLALSIGGVTIAISRIETALGVQRFEAAHRPDAAVTRPQHVMSRLYGHRAAIAVRVTGPDQAAKTETRLAVCYIAVIQILALSTPGLIHWSRSDTLFTLEEFLGITGAQTPVRPRPAALVLRNKPRRAAERPNASHAAQHRGSNTLFTHRAEAARIEAVRRRVLSAGKVNQPIAPRLPRLNAALTQGAVVGLTAPIGLGVGLQDLLAGLKLS